MTDLPSLPPVALRCDACYAPVFVGEPWAHCYECGMRVCGAWCLWHCECCGHDYCISCGITCACLSGKCHLSLPRPPPPKSVSPAK